MSDNKLFLEELKYLVENELSLNEYVIDQLEERFEKNPFLITQLYQILAKNKKILPFFNDIEATIYDYIVSEEMANEKTYYGATKYVAELFDTTQTYIKCKVNQSRYSLRKIS
ncbi:hypothetical protein [uncultured Metabacillus sp.]|uniref:hypothetical protein n=1 Tax=uncultured Metabacillus sp. TaxID=2860135 RepID=UPI002632A9A7|nr:hypothetical protein [uncultured Metabacillus sp.]